MTRRLLINGVYIGVEELRARENKRGTLVLLHGFTGSALGWGKLLDDLAEEGLHVIALDMLGHGESDAPEEAKRYEMEYCQADILAILQQLGVPRGEAILLGYSMGGRIALYSAFSGYFRALILESASAGLADTQEREQRRKSDAELAERIEREGIEAFVAYWEKLPLFVSQAALTKEQWARQREQRLKNHEQGLANSLRGVGTGAQPALQTRLSELEIPTLLLAGELDGKFCRIAKEMAGMIPQARLQIVAGAGHTIHLEQPALFYRYVSTFVQHVSKYRINVLI